MKAFIIAAVIGIALLLSVPTASFIYESGAPDACARCHEMTGQVSKWHASTHRNVPCSACHGDALTTDPKFHLTNAKRVVDHIKGDVPEQTNLKPGDVFAITARCQRCHTQEFAAWSTGPHAITYKQIFLDQKHNKTRHLMDDCLRCHGMHFDGSVRDLVTPLNNQGPWTLKRAELSDQPVIPCLSCHSMHRQGKLLDERRLESKTLGNRQERFRPGLAFFDRREMTGVSVALLPMPGMKEGDRPIKVAQDQRQALCYQCHAPLSTMQVKSGDDRTPIGVHEGLSCLACHDKHRQTTHASCTTCHPKLSNCGLDVEKMDTTFAKTNSKNNIHWVKCADCHPKGIPAKKQKLAVAAAPVM
jgi:DnaJ-class molecular chaperone